MQTNFQDRQSALITEAIETIQEQVKLKGSPSFLDMKIKSIPYTDSELCYDGMNDVSEIGEQHVFSEDGDEYCLFNIDCDTIVKLADYCLNYNPTTNNAN